MPGIFTILKQDSMKNVAVIAGGDSGEYQISINSARIVAGHIDTQKYRVFLIEIKGGDWVYSSDEQSEIQVDKNDFSLLVGGEKIRFDVVFNVIHGTPGEDGKILGYFEMLGIPFTSSSAIASALTFNKAYCNQAVRSMGVAVAQSVHLFKNQAYNVDDVLGKVQLPCFVKPNQGGSSVGMSKVKEAGELQPALAKAFEEDSEVLIEEFIEGRELTIGVLFRQDELLTFPITEVISKNEFFDYEAKYNSSLNQEVTPAQIPVSLKEEIQRQAQLIYRSLNLKGVVRIDFIHSMKGLYFLEVNTVPGMSTESIVPKQIREMGYQINDLFQWMLDESLSV